MLATPTTMKRKNLKGLSLPGKSASDGSGTASALNGGGGGGARPGSVASAPPGVETLGMDHITDRISSLEIGIEFKVNLRAEDLKTISELGFGNGGTVSKVMHIPTKTIMARKVIKIDAKVEARKRILRELQIMHDCNSPYIIGFHGAFMIENDVHVCMEHMDCGSLDAVLVKKGKLPIEVVGKVTYSVVEGLIYLYDVHRIIHRDVKPSNVLINSAGKIKLCDFGVSGELINSVANTFVGTSTYMSPERIQGAAYSVKGDVWSLGLMLVELTTGSFPFGSRAMGVLDLLQLIVQEPAPTIDPIAFPSLSALVAQCLKKDPKERASLNELLNCEFVSHAKKQRVDVAKWAKSTQSFRKVELKSTATTPASAAAQLRRPAPAPSAGARSSPIVTSPTAASGRLPPASAVASSGAGLTLGLDGVGGGDGAGGGGGGERAVRPKMRESRTTTFIPDLLQAPATDSRLQQVAPAPQRPLSASLAADGLQAPASYAT